MHSEHCLKSGRKYDYDVALVDVVVEIAVPLFITL